MTDPHDHSHACHDHACGHGDLAEHHRQDAVCLDHVSFTYGPRRGANGNGARNGKGGTVALRDVTLHIEQGCNLGIIGPNGAGKTTLLKIMLGLLEGYSGSATVLGMTPRAACRKGDVIGYVPQRIEAEWRFPITAEQVVLMGLTGKAGLFHRYSAEDRSYAHELLKRVGLIDLSGRPIGELSGGQQQRLFIARALVAKPKILILDEPMVGIDEVGQRQFAQLIHELHESLGLTVIVVSHDLQAIAAGCNRVACLNQTIHYHAQPAGLTEDVLREVFQHDIAPVLRKA